MSHDAEERHYTAGGIERTLHAPNQLEYRILISVPKEAPPEKGYPVIYALDGDAVFDTLAEAARLQTRKPHGYDPVVVVGIAYPSREPFDMARRCYDFTTPARNEDLPKRPDGSQWPERGGVDAFLDFIERVLKPEIANTYPIDTARQSIFGHSLGGLCVLHALFSRPQAFQCYAAGSPSIWWNNYALLQKKEAFEAEALPQEMPRLLITIGADELPHMVKDAEQMAESLQPMTGRGLRTELVKFLEEGHVSVLPAAISRVLKFALKSTSTDNI